ncbi:MAG: hypothetical protein A2653_02975 [Candidatus Zambryskibacteria bacterium RIFCSPHIGHO2_01_FULL_43_25]|uniref:Uncharacterized protein n=1 Tax=Candidatus Zambryskibacteria bacterium RIFCSPLOWO2_01_FULL_45_21 TaxID=1802761 RepID=A0A1G2U0P0_9BACT|nr:MAG: hypothetical protein A2653_02975 [Candidatus Zambryskibacteria bacterium RIFCSPHIGHO2_01_FULL_43_25]OHB00941.1 MAG: hypothetical protein A3E94_00175 [Candidatus Zambryskibacteria bacterium RIFCSPHIGHO2_12_FULL_44_12b]OHB02969.1 MAG: hypothetical protein A3B14_00820 [Candidatus Zambryskibacteria bacterium RIFCSPLOWO2_01_FULL_45_21]
MVDWQDPKKIQNEEVLPLHEKRLQTRAEECRRVRKNVAGFYFAFNFLTSAVSQLISDRI